MSAFVDQSGKVALSIFDDLFEGKFGKQSKEVLQGPKFGVDTSVIDLGSGQGLVVSSDPLSLIPSLGLKESAWLSVQLLVNDMATSGHAPQFAQFTLNLPPELSREDFKTYWGYVHEFCSEVGVAITGGHTGQIPGQNSTIAGGGTMFLKAPLERIISSAGVSAGDAIIVTKQAAMTASSILAKSFPNTVREHIGEALLYEAQDNFFRTSVLQEAQIAASVLAPKVELKAMHDATEGGILGAIDEMATAANCGFTVDNELLPIHGVTAKVCEVFEIDPRFCVGAGSMIIATAPGCENALIHELADAGIAAKCVGYFENAPTEKFIIENEEKEPFQFDGKDPYWEAFFKALTNKLT